MLQMHFHFRILYLLHYARKNYAMCHIYYMTGRAAANE